jgi:hypothetical protein
VVFFRVLPLDGYPHAHAATSTLSFTRHAIVYLAMLVLPFAAHVPRGPSAGDNLVLWLLVGTKKATTRADFRIGPSDTKTVSEGRIIEQELRTKATASALPDWYGHCPNGHVHRTSDVSDVGEFGWPLRVACYVWLALLAALVVAMLWGRFVDVGYSMSPSRTPSESPLRNPAWQHPGVRA